MINQQILNSYLTTWTAQTMVSKNLAGTVPLIWLNPHYHQPFPFNFEGQLEYINEIGLVTFVSINPLPPPTNRQSSPQAFTPPQYNRRIEKLPKEFGHIFQLV